MDLRGKVDFLPDIEVYCKPDNYHGISSELKIVNKRPILVRHKPGCTIIKNRRLNTIGLI